MNCKIKIYLNPLGIKIVNLHADHLLGFLYGIEDTREYKFAEEVPDYSIIYRCIYNGATLPNLRVMDDEEDLTVTTNFPSVARPVILRASELPYRKEKIQLEKIKFKGDTFPPDVYRFDYEKLERDRIFTTFQFIKRKENDNDQAE
jgi:hypothetical protein